MKRHLEEKTKLKRIKMQNFWGPVLPPSTEGCMRHDFAVERDLKLTKGYLAMSGQPVVEAEERKMA